MKRSSEPEWMDDPSRDPEETEEALRVLARLNRLGRAAAILVRLCGGGRILDVAAGGADLSRSLVARGVARLAVAVDRGPEMVERARRKGRGVLPVRADARALPFRDGAFDAAFCHLFLHHLDEEEAVAVLREMARVARRVVVLDLRRSRAGLAMVWLLTRFTTNALARHDGPVSVRRAWTAAEAEELARRAGLSPRVRRHLFGRLSITAETSGE